MQEQVGNSLVRVVEGYMIETGKRILTPELAENTIFNPELSYTWYVDYFKGKGTVTVLPISNMACLPKRRRDGHVGRSIPQTFTSLATPISEHENYIGSNPDFGTVVVSIIHEMDDKNKHIRALIRTKHVRSPTLISQLYGALPSP
jgi:hypothetical protein